MISFREEEMSSREGSEMIMIHDKVERSQQFFKKHLVFENVTFCGLKKITGWKFGIPRGLSNQLEIPMPISNSLGLSERLYTFWNILEHSQPFWKILQYYGTFLNNL